MEPAALKRRQLKGEMDLLVIERDRHWGNYCQAVTKIMRLAVELEEAGKVNG